MMRYFIHRRILVEVKNMASQLFVVVVHQAEGLLAADSNGLSDPFCEVYLGTKKFNTKVLFN